MLDELNEQKPLEKGTRVASMVLDYLIMSLVGLAFALPATYLSTAAGTEGNHEIFSNTNSFGFLAYISAIGAALLLVKDSFNGQSIAKRLFKLQVVDDETGKAASPMKCFVRNLTYIISPIEFILVIVKPEKRIGDMIVKTHIDYVNPEEEEVPVDMQEILLPFAIAYVLCAMYATFMLEKVENTTQSTPIAIVENSENQALSQQIAQAFSEKYGSVSTTDVKIYDEIEGGENLKFISIIMDLEPSYSSAYMTFEAFKMDTYSFLLSKYPVGTFVGQIKYIEPQEEGDKIRILPLDWRKTE